VNDDTCMRCSTTIVFTEPYARLEGSLRSYVEDEDAIEVLHAVGFGPLCRICGEQLHLTSPAVGEATKLLRCAQEIPALEHACSSLPSLPQLTLVSPAEAGMPAMEHCWGCWSKLANHPNWLEVSLVYERTHWNTVGEGIEVEVLDYYATVSLCQSCWRQVPLASLSDDAARAAQWIAVCVHLLEQQDKRGEG
jgi:hypothetical protein